MKKPAGPLCCLEIGYRHVLLPADKGMKVLALLQGAIECDERYRDQGVVYVVGEPLRIRFTSVEANQVAQQEPEKKPAVLQIAREPLKLEHSR